MKTAEIWYKGNLRTNARHLRSGEEIISDAPIDNHGKGEAFSPTDHLSTSLASCMITIMGLKATQSNIDLKDIKGSLKKEMTSNPRRVKSIEIWLTVFGNFSDREKEMLYNSAINCPVAKSLSPEIDQILHLEFAD